jgi:precorrin-8X/cobalt-precorrin-8 methylmutase
MTWPVPGGWLSRLGAPPEAIERRSRGIAREMAGARLEGAAAEVAAAIVYASGDPALLDSISIRGPLELGELPVLVDVGMVRAGLRFSGETAVAVEAPGAAELAARTGTTRAAAGVKLLWEEFGAGGLVVVGNAPTALLAALDLAQAAPPRLVVASCPGFTLAEAAKAALVESGLPHVAVCGTRGGSGLAAAAANVLLRMADGS